MYIITENKEQYIDRRIMPIIFVSAGQSCVSNNENEVAARIPL
jgi:hypothetical protein